MIPLCGACGSAGSPRSSPIFGPSPEREWLRVSGLIGVVSLPRAFVFRINFTDPHPVPWIRVKLSCAIGHSLYPHPQWRKISDLWSSYYPIGDLADERRDLFARLESSFPEFISVLTNPVVPNLRGRSLPEAMEVGQRSPAQLKSFSRSGAMRRNSSIARLPRSPSPSLAKPEQTARSAPNTKANC